MRKSIGIMCVLLFTTTHISAAMAQTEEPEQVQAAPTSDKEKVMQSVELDDEAARGHFKVGQSLYDTGRFEESAKEFDLAFDLSQRPPLLYNCYIAHRDAGNTQLAADRLEQYLSLIDKDLTGRPKLEAALVNLKAQLKEDEAKNVAQAESEEARKNAEANAAKAQVTSNTLKDSKSKRTRRILGFALGGAGAVAIGVGVIFGLKAITDADAISNNCPPSNSNVCERGFDLADAIDRARGKARLANVMFIAGGLVFAAGLTLILTAISGKADSDEPVQTNPAVPEVAAACGWTGCQMDLAWNF